MENPESGFGFSFFCWRLYLLDTRTIFHDSPQAYDEAKTFRIVEAMLIQRHDVDLTESIVFNVQIGNDTPRYYSFERVWTDMSPCDLVVNLNNVYLDKHNHLLATLTAFPRNGKPLYMYQVVILALNTTPTPIPAPFGIHTGIGTRD